MLSLKALAQRESKSMYPFRTTNGARVDRVCCHTFYSAMRQVYPQVTGTAYRDFLAGYPDDVAQMKRQEMEARHVEYHIAMINDSPVAFLAGEGMNEENFHLRYVGVTLAHRRSRLAKDMVEQLCRLLRKCFYRLVNALHSVENFGSMALAMSLGFTVYGLEDNSSWGWMVQTRRFVGAQEDAHSLGRCPPESRSAADVLDVIPQWQGQPSARWSKIDSLDAAALKRAYSAKLCLRGIIREERKLFLVFFQRKGADV